jgi:hypothetical protein
MANTRTEKTINELKPRIIEVVSPKLAKIEGTKDVAIAWKKMQDVAAKEIISLISQHLPDSVITSPTSKSTYPDIKIVNTEGQFAIDIKANEDSKQPWFDMGRMDTMLKTRMSKYIQEWEFVIRFDSSNGQFIKAYFNLLREIAGIRNECDGVKFRPYDGQVRPKSWNDLDNEVVYWDSKEKFITGLNKSIKHRWKMNIKNHLVPKLSSDEKQEFKKLFD